MCCRSSLRPLDQLVLEHRSASGAAGRSSVDPLLELERRRRPTRTRRARSRSCARCRRPMAGFTAWTLAATAVGALGDLEHRERRVLEQLSLTAGVRLVARGEHDPGDRRHRRRRWSRSGSRRGCRRGRPGTITSVPSTRSSRKCSTLIAATRTARTSRWRPSSPQLDRRSAPSASATSADGGVRRAPAARAARRRAAPSSRPPALAPPRRRARGGHAVDDDAEELAALLLERLARHLHGRAWPPPPSRRGPRPAPGQPSALASRAFRSKSSAGAAPVKSVPSQTTTSKSSLELAVGRHDALLELVVVARGRSPRCASASVSTHIASYGVSSS